MRAKEALRKVALLDTQKLHSLEPHRLALTSEKETKETPNKDVLETPLAPVAKKGQVRTPSAIENKSQPAASFSPCPTLLAAQESIFPTLFRKIPKSQCQSFSKPAVLRTIRYLSIPSSNAICAGTSKLLANCVNNTPPR